MSKIQVLDRRTAELLAAGEVVERPASVVKELVENSLDAGSTAITVEIERGGIVYIRVTDNGSGISREDVPTAFLRHATSKIRNEEDLDGINTLGFRGEALAAICAVSKTEVLTGNGTDIGTHYVIEGGVEASLADAGCPKGTTIIVRDIFFNTPARMKFLKKDVTEGNAVSSVVEKLALSHPEVAFRFIRDGKTIFSTPGDNNLASSVYAVLGREFALSQLKVEGETSGIKVTGYTCKPANCRANRTSQYFFVNGRLFKSDTVGAALEQAYKNSAMIGRFPSCVLNIYIDPQLVDVNVHPAKTEVRFADKKSVFDAVYYSVKSAIESRDIRPEISISSAKSGGVKPSYSAIVGVDEGDSGIQVKLPSQKPITVSAPAPAPTPAPVPKASEAASRIVLSDNNFSTYNLNSRIKEQLAKTEEAAVKPAEPEKKAFLTETVKAETSLPISEKNDTFDDILEEEEKAITYIGEVFKTYLIAEMDGDMYFIDKHAAHERILYNKIKSEKENGIQLLLPPLPVTLSTEDYDTVIENLDILEQAGFSAEDFGNSILVTAVPATVIGMDIAALIEDLAVNLKEKRLAVSDKIDRIYETAACRAAVKAGNINGRFELEQFAKKVLSSKEIMYCPHGRPIAVKLTKGAIEKQFGRLG